MKVLTDGTEVRIAVGYDKNSKTVVMRISCGNELRFDLPIDSVQCIDIANSLISASKLVAKMKVEDS